MNSYMEAMKSKSRSPPLYSSLLKLRDQLLEKDIPGRHNSGLLEQCSDVWALLRSEPTFLWKNQFELIFHEICSTNNRFNSFMTKLLSKFFFRLEFEFEVINRPDVSRAVQNQTIHCQFLGREYVKTIHPHHVSHTTCHLSHVTCHFFFGGGGTKLCSLLVEGRLSTRPTPSSFFTPLKFVFWT